MKTKSLLLAFGIALFGFSASAQDYVFRVLTSKGNNTYKSASGDWEALKTGTTLNAGDEIKTEGSCYVAMLHASGKPFEIKEAKEYKVDDLNQQLGGEESGIIGKYAGYVMSKMSEEEKESNRKAYATVTGATKRGELGEISVYLKPTASVFNNDAVIRWKPREGADTYVVTLKNWFDDVIMVTETQDNMIKIDFTDNRLKDMELVILNVAVKGEEKVDSGDYSIQRVNKEKEQGYTTELVALQTDLDANSSINNLILAEFYEQNSLYLDALTSYESAIQQSPDVEYFKEAYTEFLMRNRWNDKLDSNK